MRLYRRVGLWIPVVVLGCVSARGQTPDADADMEPVAIFEIGGASSTSLTEGGSSFGPDLAVEVTPVENWLELELGITPFFRRHHSAEWDTDLLFKKPWDLSKKLEFMAGFGPEWVHTAGTNSLAVEAALDFMFWPRLKHRFGMFLEPTYDYNFAGGHEQSFGVTLGLLIGIR